MGSKGEIASSRHGGTRNDMRGVTLIEIIIATLILGLISAGVFTAFVFSRRVSWRSESELRVAEFAQNVADQLRTVVLGDNTLTGLSLNPGIYYDQSPSRPGTPSGTRVNLGLSTSPELDQFKVLVIYYVEDHTIGGDKDGTGGPDGQGRDFNGDGLVDLKWTKVVVDWIPPEAS